MRCHQGTNMPHHVPPFLTKKEVTTPSLDGGGHRNVVWNNPKKPSTDRHWDPAHRLQQRSLHAPLLHAPTPPSLTSTWTEGHIHVGLLHSQLGITRIAGGGKDRNCAGALKEKLGDWRHPSSTQPCAWQATPGISIFITPPSTEQ